MRIEDDQKRHAEMDTLDPRWRARYEVQFGPVQAARRRWFLRYRFGLNGPAYSESFDSASDRSLAEVRLVVKFGAQILRKWDGEL